MLQATWYVHRALKQELADTVKSEAGMEPYLSDQVMPKVLAMREQRREAVREVQSGAVALDSIGRVPDVSPWGGESATAISSSSNSSHELDPSTTTTSSSSSNSSTGFDTSSSNSGGGLNPHGSSSSLGGAMPGGHGGTLANSNETNGRTSSSSSSSSSVTMSGGTDPYTLWDYYLDCWLPFGNVLTDMEAEGVKVDR